MKIAYLSIFLRQLAKNKTYTVINILGLSVSLMFVIILSVYVKNELSVDNFHLKKDRIYLISNETSNFSPTPIGRYINDLIPEIESFTRVTLETVKVEINTMEKLSANILFADSSFFNIFTFPLTQGDISSVLTVDKSVVLTESFANKSFQDRNPLGLKITIDNIDHTITGIMKDIPANTHFPEVDLIVKYNSLFLYKNLDENSWTVPIAHTYFLQKAGSNLSSKSETIKEAFNKDYFAYRENMLEEVFFIPLQKVYFTTPDFHYITYKTNNRTTVLVLMAIVILILVIGLINYVNMTVAQAGFRMKDAAIKRLYGCSKRELIIQSFLESVLVITFTFLIGVLLALAFEPFINNLLNTRLNILKQLAYNIIFIILFILFISFISGIIPGLISASYNSLEVIKGTFKRKVKNRYSKLLIGFQNIISIVLIICCIFMTKQTNYLFNYDMNINKENIFILQNVLNTRSVVNTFRNSVEAIPGVEITSFNCGTPIDGGNRYTLSYNNSPFMVYEYVVDNKFFELFGINIEETGLSVNYNTVYVNNKLYQALLPEMNQYNAIIDEHVFKVAGVTQDFNFNSLHHPIGYVSMRLMDDERIPWTLAIKIADVVNKDEVVDNIKKTYETFTKGDPYRSGFLTEADNFWYEKEKKTSIIINAFSILALLMMIMGVYAMSLYMIKQKEKEIGIRKINGATINQIIFLLTKQSILILVISFIISCPLAYYIINNWISNFAYRINISPFVFLFTGLLILALTILSVLWQSWKAASTNPILTLQKD